MNLVDAAHQRELLGARADWLVVQAGTADGEKLALAA
jgi:hypothetical protein